MVKTLLPSMDVYTLLSSQYLSQVECHDQPNKALIFRPFRGNFEPITVERVTMLIFELHKGLWAACFKIRPDDFLSIGLRLTMEHLIHIHCSHFADCLITK